MTFAKYEIYRSSGADYLGDVPAHWDVRPLKHLATFTSGGTPSKERPEFWDGEIPWASAKDLKMEVLLDTTDHITDAAVDEGGAQLVPKGAILVLVRGMMLARMFPVCVVGRPMAINQDLKALMPRPGVRDDYLAWLLRGTAPETLNRLDEAGHGTKALRMGAWSSMKLPVPPESEQQFIAVVLSRETAKIDALMGAQRRLIELLKEKRQAVISHAVTKGLDPSAAMKDSGVEWLGQVPAHWEVRPFKYAIAKIESGTSVNAAEVPALAGELGVLKTSCVYSGEFRPEENKAVNADEIDRLSCPARAGTLIVSRMNTPDLVGAAGLVTADYPRIFLPDRLWQVHFVGVSPAFAHRWTQSGSYRAQVQVACAGTSASMQNLAQDQLRNFAFPYPPYEEQLEIAAALEAACRQTDQLVAEAERSIHLLQERRAAVISAAVTGKIDVRGWTATEVRTAVAAEIIRLHARKPTFGRVKNQKLLYLAEAHAGITEIGGRYERKAAGPYDADLIALVERDLEAAGVMTVSQPEGTGSTVSYSLNRSWKPDNERLKAMLGGRLAAFEQVNAKLADLKTRDAEAVATLYAVWNDALIDGEACDDARVIRGFLDEWHPEKREKFKQAELHTWLGWMRRNGIVPSGWGPRTGIGGLFG